MNIQQIEQEIISEFDLFDDWIEKYNYIIELGRALPSIDEKDKEEKFLIKGCQSRVWLLAGYRDGKVFYTADSDALITKGIAALLIRALSGHEPGEILGSELNFIEKTGLKEHLSQTRSNGLSNMIKQMKLYALAFQSRSKN